MAVLFTCLILGSSTLTLSDLDQRIRVAVKELEPFSYCCVSHKGAFGDMGSVLNDLIAIMQSQRLTPSGDLIAVYHINPTQGIAENVEYEVGFPITAQLFPQPPLQKKEWNHVMVAAAEHRGTYDTTDDTIDQILDWMEANRYTQDGPILGRFLVIPTHDVSPANLRTEIWIPIKKQ
jgi:effector-binding domain-containing protein